MPYTTGTEVESISKVMQGGLASDGHFTKECQKMLTAMTGSSAFLTQSCTAALEMAAILSNVTEGDEVTFWCAA